MKIEDYEKAKELVDKIHEYNYGIEALHGHQNKICLVKFDLDQKRYTINEDIAHECIQIWRDHLIKKRDTLQGMLESI